MDAKVEAPSMEIIEHVVLFNIKDEEDPERVNAMVNGLNKLSSQIQDEVLYLTAGPILRTRISPPDLRWTHMLHARYRSKSDLSTYSDHPAHVWVVENLGKPIVEDKLTLDWVAHGLDGPIVPRPGSAMRVTLFNLDEPELRDSVLEALAKIKGCYKESINSIEQMSYGENFSIEKGKGYNLASLVVFPDLNELDACEEFEDQVRSLLSKLKHHSPPPVIAVDYVVPRLPPPSSP